MRITAQSFSLIYCLFLIFQLQCIQSLTVRSRIVAGRPTKSTQYPWQVALRKSKYGQLHGSGSIIARNWVLTAAHCLHGVRSIHLVFGTIYWIDRNALLMFSKEFYPHSKFNNETYQHDIALIKLNRPLKYSVHIQPVNLVSLMERENNFQGSRGIITGFGNINDGIPNPFYDLLQAVVIIISNAECAEIYTENVFESTMCSVGADNADQSICDGDSGGPLITRDRNGNLILIGVISFSADISCEEKYPSGFTRVSHYLEFIAQVTNITLN